MSMQYIGATLDSKDAPDCRVVVIASADYETTFELQKAYEFDEQDAKLGMDTYCIVHNGLTHYGGITAYSLEQNILELHVDKDAQIDIELPSVIRFDVAWENLELTQEYLKWILG